MDKTLPEMLDPSALETLQLARGDHKDRSNGLCAMEVVAWLAGKPHTDSPPCVSRVITKFVQGLNDRMRDDERQMLKPYLVRLVGTKGSKATERRRMFMAADFAVREAAVMSLRARGRDADAAKLGGIAEIVDKETAQQGRAAAAAYAAYAAADAAAADADAADAAAYAADAYAADAAAAAAAADADAAAYAADAAAAAAAYAADAAAAAAARKPVWEKALACLNRMIEVTP